jgi:zinc D-Ala-D-Ala carboxypeptidase
MQRLIYTIFYVSVFFLIGCAWAANKKEDTTVNMTTAKKKELSEREKQFRQIVDTVSVAYLMGKFEPSTHQDFTKISTDFTDKKDAYLRKEAYDAFLRMAAAAQKEKVQLKILSATRNFNRQKKIWQDKWRGLVTVEDGTKVSAIKDTTKRALKILLFSAMPGTSRHHWGTDIDLNYLSDDYFTHGQGEKIYQWLTTHAAEYGFCQPYSSKANGRAGYNEEKWHWTYMPLSAPFTAAAEKKMKNEMIDGFDGAGTAAQIDVVKKYVLGINQDCLDHTSQK